MKALAKALLTLMLLAGAASAQKTIDQILVIVNDEIITRSDLLWAVALDPESPSPTGNLSPDVLRRMLEVMIDQRLVYQEAAKIPSSEITEEEVNQKRNDLIRRFGSEAAFRERVESVGLTSSRIDELMRQRIVIERFVEFRFRSFLFVSEDEVRRYYDEQIVPRVREAGQIPPPIEQVRDQITEVLKREKFDQELDRWLKETRQRSDIAQIAVL
jgi:peptidyl-prolyl cis-trans isomerase SurA